MKFLETNRFLETTRNWIIFTIVVISLALFIHFAGMTDGYRCGFAECSNWYHTWPRFDEITHPLSSCAVTAIILNLNLPMSYRKKWIIMLIFGMVFGVLWEIAEVIMWTSVWWIDITLIDTALDLHQDFYGSALAILLYTITMRASSDHLREDFFL